MGSESIFVQSEMAASDDEVRFQEELPRTPLSDRDRDVFLAILDNPPPPNEALLKAAAKYKKRHG
jgi:uncharacterized protein (DUF1778 family)